MMVFTVSSLTGPTGEAAGQGGDAVDGAVQLPERAQAYIDESTRDLAEWLGIKSDEVRLESVTEPAEVDGTYFTKLEAGGRVYEYHGRDGSVLLVSEGLPLNSGWPGAVRHAHRSRLVRDGGRVTRGSRDI